MAVEPTPDFRSVAAVYINELAFAHDEHTWQQIGRCVYCVDCNQRLFQGTIGKGHAKVKATRRWDDPTHPEKTTAMRERWGKD